jgi:predicted metalloprotease
MRWLGRRGSGNIDDRRGMGGPVLIGGGIIGVIAFILNLLLGGDPSQLVTQGQQAPMTEQEKAVDDSLAQFVSVVLAETEDVWTKIFAKEGQMYQKPTLVLFRNVVQSGCGNAGSASGPFYCPADGNIYIDLSFYHDLKERFHAPGDFPMAYVIAHEVGHHIQNLTGTAEKMHNLRGQVSEKDYNKYSVMQELQADFYAGVWAHYIQHWQNILEPGDIEEALTAASAIGDDRLQKQSQGYVVPDAFTHGTSEQRMYWFKKGYETGDIHQGNTFEDPNLQ